MAIKKVFEIQMTGTREVNKNIRDIKKAMTETGKAIASTKAELDQLLNAKGDNTQIADLTKKIEQLNKSYEALKKQRNQAQTDAKRESDIAKELSAQKVREAKEREANAKAAKAEDNAKKAKIQTDAAEERQARKNKSAQEALAGSYNATYRAYRELYNLVKATPAGQAVSFQGQNLQWDEAITKLKSLAKAEQDFRRQFAKDGLLVGEYTSGIVQAFKDMNIDDLLRKQVDGAKQSIGELEKKTNDLIVAYRQAQQAGTEDMNKLEKEIHDTVKETQALKTAVSQAEVQLRGIDGVGAQITNSIKNGIKELKTSIGQFIVTYFGIQAAISGVQSGVGNARELSDQVTELEIQLNKAAGGLDKFVAGLSKMDTRTKLVVLEQIAEISTKAGVAEENLMGVTRAIDITKTAFGKDFGDIESGTETFVKLINIFYEDGEVTEERILRMGNAIRQIANESVASVPYINDFAGRMAGVRQVANVTLPQIIGLGAGFEEFKQSTEVSSTVLVKLIPAIARDLDKFAKVAGMTREEFKKLLNENPIEAVLKASEGLVNSGEDIEAFSVALKESGIEAGRATTIIATMGGKADVFRKRIESANTAITSTAAITDAYARKNDNLAATYDKISKKLADAANSKEFQATLSVIGAIILALISNLPILLTLIGLYTAGWALANKEMLITRGLLIFQRTVMPILTILLGGQANALRAYAAASALAAKGMQLLKSVISHPAFKIIGAILGLSAIAARTFAKSVDDAASSVREFAIRNQFMREAQVEANKQMAETIARENTLLAIIRDRTIADQVRTKALNDLKTMMGEYGKDLTLENILTDKGTEALKKYNEQLERRAKNSALIAIREREGKKLETLYQYQSDIEGAIAGGGSITTGQFSEEFMEEFYKSVGRSASSIGKWLGDKVGIDFKYSNKKDLKQFSDFVKKKIESQLIRATQSSIAAGTDSETETTTAPKTETGLPEAGTQTIEDLKKQLEAINQEIKAIDQIKNKSKEQLARLKDLRKQRAETQRQIKELGGSTKESTYKGSRITGEDRDALRDIDAVRDTELAEQKQKFLQLEIDEQTYLKNVLKINTDANDKKLAELKAANAAERKLVADLNLQKITDLQDTNKKLFDLQNKQLQNDLRNSVAQQESILQTIDRDPSLSETERVKAKQQVLDNLLKLQIDFNQKQIALEKQLGIISEEEAQKRVDAIREITEKSLQNERTAPGARLKDIETEGNIAIAQIKQEIAAKTVAILSSRESAFKKARALDLLQKEESERLLQAEIDTLQKKEAEAKKQRDQRLISEKEYQDILTDLKTKEAALTELTTDKQVSAMQRLMQTLKGLKDQFLETFLGIKQYTSDAAGEQERIADAISSAYSTVKDAISAGYKAYFDNERARVDQQTKDQADQLAREEKRVLARAESENEKASIERQFDQKRKDLEKKAAEQKKKIALKQLSIDFAVALMKTFAQFGFPLGLIPAAALALQYGIQRGIVNKQQFAGGGRVLPDKKIPHVRNGKITIAPNIPALRNRDNILATLKTNEVVLNEKQQRALGGPAVFRRIGVPGFASGGLVTAPQFGTSLKPPAFNSGYYSSGVNASYADTERMDRLEAVTEKILDAVYSSDKKPVVLNPKNVTKAQKRNQRDVGLAEI